MLSVDNNCRKKTILILHPHFTLAGGAGTFVLEVGQRLASHGFRVIVVSIRSDRNLVGKYEGTIEFIDLGGPLSSSLKFWILLPISVYKVIRLTYKINPDIVFPQVFPANWWGFLLKIVRPRTKILWMCQEPSAFIHSKVWINAIKDPLMRFLVIAFNPALKLIDRFLCRKADYVFANSEYAAKYAQQVYGYHKDRIEHVYLGANPKFAETGRFYSNTPRPAQIVTVGRLTKFKNVDLVIHAIDELQRLGVKDAQLKIVGRGEEEESLKQLVGKLGLGRQVEFCGALSELDLIKVLVSSKAFVLASVDEPFGLTVVEALACGTPAVVVNSGGPAEIVQDRVSGFYVPPKDKFSLAEKLKILLVNDSEFKKMSDNAKKRARIFDWDLTTQRISEKIQQITADSAAALQEFGHCD